MSLPGIPGRDSMPSHGLAMPRSPLTRECPARTVLNVD